MDKERILIYLPIVGLLILIVVLYSPQIIGSLTNSSHIPLFSDLSFMDKTTVLLTFALASFAAVEGFSTYKRASMEHKRHAIEDGRNELEKAYGPLFTILNKPTEKNRSIFWLDFDERRKIDEIIATYPFMFPSEITELWQLKIRDLASTLDSSLESAKYDAQFDVYLELKKLINKEYDERVLNYRLLLAQ